MLQDYLRLAVGQLVLKKRNLPLKFFGGVPQRGSDRSIIDAPVGCGRTFLCVRDTHEKILTGGEILGRPGLRFERRRRCVPRCWSGNHLWCEVTKRIRVLHGLMWKEILDWVSRISMKAPIYSG